MDRTNGFISFRGGTHLVAGQACNTEIRHLNGAVGKQHNVLRLNIAMYYRLIMSVLKCAKNLHREVYRLFPADVLALIQVLFKSDAVDILHHNVLQTLTKTHIQHLNNVGMIQDGNRLRLVAETAHKLLAVQKFILKNLDGNNSIVHYVIGFIYVGHTTDADQFAHFIATIQTLTQIFIHI